MPFGALKPPPDLTRALRAHLATHNLRVALLAALTLVGALTLWYVLHLIANWLALLFVTAVQGTEARVPTAIENLFWLAAAALLAVAWIDRQLRPDDRPKDHKSIGEIVWEILLVIPRLTLSVWGTLSAWQHLDSRELAEAVTLIERLAQEHRIRLSSMPLEISNDRRRFKILFALQLVQIIDLRREDRELWVALNPLRPRNFMAAPPTPRDQSPACAP